MTWKPIAVSEAIYCLKQCRKTVSEKESWRKGKAEAGRKQKAESSNVSRILGARQQWAPVYTASLTLLYVAGISASLGPRILLKVCMFALVTWLTT